MIDTQVVGMNWIEVPAGQYELVPPDRRKSHCQIEIKLRWNAFISHAPEGDWSKIAPLRILSFDIECAGKPGRFPTADQDPVIQIANMVTRQGETQPFIRNVFTLNSCSHIVGSQVLSFDDEQQMLEKWRDFVEEVDPDLIIGYNIAGFDFPYLIDRAKELGSQKFPYLGRLKGENLFMLSSEEFSFIIRQMSRLELRTLIFRLRHTASGTPKRLPLMADYSLMSCSSCNESINFVATP